MPAVAFVVNTNLAKATTRFISLCRAAAARAGWTPEFALTDKGDAGITAAGNAVASEADLVIAVGGDGTVRGCAQALADTGVPLGIIPLGTANILARTLGLPLRPGPALGAALSLESRDRRIDLATAVIGDRDPAIGDRVLFTAMTGMGLDAAVVSGTRFKRRLGWLGYAFSGLAHLPDPPATYTIRLDGGEPIIRSARCVVAGNSGLLPGGWTLLPEARLDDGLLDVGIMAPRGPLGWPRLTARVLLNRHVQDQQLERFRAREVEITAHRTLPREVDGEIVSAATTLRAGIRPGALTVRVPAA